jgi:hypothetical protein
VVLSLIAAILGLLGFGFYAGLTAGGGFVFGLADILRNRGFISVPRSALDDQGRLKGFKAGDVG